MVIENSFSKIYGQGRTVTSLEFFPPKKAEDISLTRSLMREMVKLKPSFMTVTYGAGGGTRQSTRELTQYIAQELEIPAVAHLTCVSHSRADIDRILDELESVGVHHILALRGDPPKGASSFEPHPDGFVCARDLTAHIVKRGGFSVAVAGYPEGHPDAARFGDELYYLREKVEAGAEVIITQLFFEPDLYFRFRDQAASVGITIPIVPGVMPVSNVGQLQRFTSMCGASLPTRLMEGLEPIAGNAELVRDYGVEYAVAMVRELIAGGSPGVHYYTLNKSFQVAEILRRLNDPMISFGLAGEP